MSKSFYPNGGPLQVQELGDEEILFEASVVKPRDNFHLLWGGGGGGFEFKIYESNRIWLPIV